MNASVTGSPAAPEVAASADPATRVNTGHGTLRGDIEGLRGIAVGTVLAYHVGLPFLPSGFAGVDIFFVISGFLITSLLIREAARSGRISITAFYARRARRLLPAACVVLVVTAVGGYLLLPASRHRDLSTDVIAATLYVVNWALAGRAVDYLAEGAGVSPLQHYWSLSVEEQYYVIWPLLMIAGIWLAGRGLDKLDQRSGQGLDHRRAVGQRSVERARRWQFMTVLAVFLASFGYSVVHTASDPSAAYFVSTTRVWELAVGSLLAFAVTRLKSATGVWLEVVGWVGLALVVYAVVGFSVRSAWPGYAAAVPVFGAAALIGVGCADRGTTVGRLIANRPLVWLGGISYSLYLWHWPVVVLSKARFGEPGPLQSIAVVVVSVGLAWLSKHLVEDPIRFSPRLALSSRALIAGAMAMAVAVGVGAVVRASVPRLEVGATVAGATALVADPTAKDWQVVADPTSLFTRTGRVTPQPAVAVEDSPVYYRKGCQVNTGVTDVRTDCVYGARSSTTTLALIGDSKMGQWFSAADAIARSEGWKVQLFLKSACAFSTEGVEPDCAAWSKNLLALAKKQGAPAYALVSQHSIDDGPLGRGILDALRQLQAQGTKIVVLADTVQPLQKDVYTCVEQHPDDYPACDTPRTDAAHGRGTPPLAAAAKALDLPVVDLTDWICPPTAQVCPAVLDHTLVFRQGSHLTDTYVRTLTPMLYRALSGAGITRKPVADIGIGDVPTSLLAG